MDICLKWYTTSLVVLSILFPVHQTQALSGNKYSKSQSQDFIDVIWWQMLHDIITGNKLWTIPVLKESSQQIHDVKTYFWLILEEIDKP